MGVRLQPQTAFRCCGVRVDAVTMEDALDRLHRYAEMGRGRTVHLCNAWTLALARRDVALTAALNRGDLNLPDGTPLTWIGRRVGFAHLRRPVCGSDLLLAIAQAGRAWGLRHYLYGATPEVVEMLAARLADIAPGIKIVGIESPPFRPLTEAEETELVERVHRVKANVVWVGLGTPLQDMFIDRFRDRLGATLVAVGAAFDFVAGTKRRAPTWMQDRGLEWVFRLATEPRRLWRRYLVGNAVFLVGVARRVETSQSIAEQPSLRRVGSKELRS
jgi:N-acetylglucosaminyldiphosphoundecaprenol N-acetyl-beta-D-mannosaminyltransferase